MVLDEFLKSPTVALLVNLAISAALLPAGYWVNRYFAETTPKRFQSSIEARVKHFSRIVFAAKRGTLAAFLMPPLVLIVCELVLVLGTLMLITFTGIVDILKRPDPNIVTGLTLEKVFHSSVLLAAMALAMSTIWVFYKDIVAVCDMRAELGKLRNEIANADADKAPDDWKAEMQGKLDAVVRACPVQFE